MLQLPQPISKLYLLGAGRSSAFKQSAENLKNLLRHYKPEQRIQDKLHDNECILDFFGRYCKDTKDNTGKYEKLGYGNIIRVHPLIHQETQKEIE